MSKDMMLVGGAVAAFVAWRWWAMSNEVRAQEAARKLADENARAGASPLGKVSAFAGAVGAVLGDQRVQGAFGAAGSAVQSFFSGFGSGGGSKPAVGAA